MAKFCGAIGYAEPVETRPGFWEDRIVERTYYGDVLRNSNRWMSSQESTIDDLTLSTQISIVADEFADFHCHSMKYVRFRGACWKITEVEPQPPRLRLVLGGVYNGPTAASEV